MDSSTQSGKQGNRDVSGGFVADEVTAQSMESHGDHFPNKAHLSVRLANWVLSEDVGCLSTGVEIHSP